MERSKTKMTNEQIAKISITYQEYKNRVFERYPETILSLDVVYDKDNFNYRNINGKIEIEHIISSPFDRGQLVGAYCFIKNKRGENIEVMDKKEIELCRRTARMPNIWNNWYSEMALKTVIRRACKRYFADEVKDIDEADNHSYDLSKLDIEEKNIELFERLKSELMETTKIEGLNEIALRIKESNLRDKEKVELRNIYSSIKKEIEGNK